ncbi:MULTISPECIES: hypothetical protein [Pseudomonas]|uniref:hypothetical protein n=1 Tax=Pseudomonas TaxID=286 RepID=UPI00398FE795
MATKPTRVKKTVVTQSTEEPAGTNTIKKAAEKPLAPAKKKRVPPTPPNPPSVVEDLESPYPIPMSVVPVLGAAYGLGRRHIKDGLTYAFERWTQCRAGDEFIIWMNGIRMAEDRVSPANESDPRFFLVIPRSSLLLHFVDDVYGEVRRVGAGTVSTSERQRILILDTLPGGEGNCDGTYHTGLTFTLSHTIIDSVVASRGVDVTIRAWANMRVNDLVMFYWGPHRFELPPLQPSEVGRDLSFLITPDFLRAVGDGRLVVQFYLYDEVLDESGPCHRWSKPVPVEVVLNTTLLEEPEIIEADPDLLIVDADSLHGAPANGSVFIRRNHPAFAAGDHLIWTVMGNTPEGEEVSYSFRLPVTLASYNDISIPNAIVRSLIQSTLRISYVREREMLPSRPTVYAVAGVRHTLPEPDVLQRHGPFVEPDLRLITVAMPDYDPPGNSGDDLQVNILGEHLDGSVERVFSHRAAGVHPRFRDFLNAQYARFEGLLRTRVYYLVTGPVTVRESERRYIQIGRPARTLVAPSIQEADVTNNIDPATVGSVATFEARAEFRAGDEVIIKYVGSVTGSSTIEYVLAVGSNPFLADVPKKLIDDNLDGTLRVSYVRRRFGVDELSEEKAYTIGRALGELFPPEVVEATTGPDELDPRLVAISGATVRCRYEHPKDGDQVEVCWRGLSGAGTHFESKDANRGDTFVEVIVPPSAIGFNIHPQGRDIDVSFKVIRNGVPTDSPVLTLNLLTLSHLPGATIDSIGESAILEIPKLDDLDQTRVAPWPYIEINQRMWLRNEGTLDTDAAYLEETYVGREVSVADVNNGPAPFTPVSRLRRLKEWTPFTIDFGVTFNHTNNPADIVWFETRHHMVQTQPNVFPHPEIKYSTPPSGPEVVISPITVENKCQVLVTYPNMNQGGTDMITLYWIGDDGVPVEVGTQTGLDGGTVTFNVSNELVGVSIHTTIQLQYEVILGRGGEGSSEVQMVHVQAIPQASLPTALINNVANGGSINPASLTGDAMLRMIKWPYSAKDQVAWLTLAAPGAVTQNLLVEHRVSENEAINGFANITVLRSWLMTVPNNGTVTINPLVNFNRQNDKGMAVVFPPTQYRIAHTTALVFDSSAVYFNRKTYFLDGYPNVLPIFGPGNSIQRVASGGTRPYLYSTSNAGVVHVDANTGYATMRGNGSAVISVRDSSVPAQVRSYTVYASQAVRCVGLGRSTLGNIRSSANNAGARLPSLDEARELHQVFGYLWPMGNGLYWTSTFSHSFFFTNYYYGLNINTGEILAGKDHIAGDHFNGVGLR